MNRQRWVPWVALGGATAVGGMTMVMSAFWLMNLAALIGSPLPIALPVTVDVGGAVATVVWLAGPSKEARTWGRAVALGALAASITGNVLAHLAGGTSGPVILVIGVSAVYPVMCWLMVHFVVLLRTPARPAAKKPVSKPAPKPAAKPAPQAVELPTPLHVVSNDNAAAPSKKVQARDWFHGQVAAGRDPADIKPAEVDKAIGASGYSKKFIAEWRDDATVDATTTVAQ